MGTDDMEKRAVVMTDQEKKAAALAEDKARNVKKAPIDSKKQAPPEKK